MYWDGGAMAFSILLKRFGWLRCIFVDGRYAGTLALWLRSLLPGHGVRLEIVKRSDAHKRAAKTLDRGTHLRLALQGLRVPHPKQRNHDPYLRH